MSLSEVFAAVRPSVVAFMPTFVRADREPDVYPIIGTGFILEDGLVVTNAHVVDALLRIPMPPDLPEGRWPFTAVLFHYLDKNEFPNIPMEGYAQIPLQVLGVLRVGELGFSGPGIYYGPRKPDFNIVHVKAAGLPKLQLLADTEFLQEGTEVGTIGFPMGTAALAAPGWVHQYGPFLQRGVISAVLPFPCKAPHSFVINVMSLGGASGSPVFLADRPEAIGILNAGLMNDVLTFGLANGKPVGVTQLNTNFSYVVPSYFFSGCSEKVKAEPALKLPEDTPTLKEIIERANVIIGKQPGHNEPPGDDELFVGSENAPIVKVEIKPVAHVQPRETTETE